jgi:hypothetical protein
VNKIIFLLGRSDVIFDQKESFFFKSPFGRSIPKITQNQHRMLEVFGLFISQFEVHLTTLKKPPQTKSTNAKKRRKSRTFQIPEDIKHIKTVSENKKKMSESDNDRDFRMWSVMNSVENTANVSFFRWRENISSISSIKTKKRL